MTTVPSCPPPPVVSFGVIVTLIASSYLVVPLSSRARNI